MTTFAKMNNCVCVIKKKLLSVRLSSDTWRQNFLYLQKSFRVLKSFEILSIISKHLQTSPKTLKKSRKFYKFSKRSSQFFKDVLQFTQWFPKIFRNFQKLEKVVETFHGVIKYTRNKKLYNDLEFLIKLLYYLNLFTC